MKQFENLKIAVCFSGEPRFFAQCADNINKFFSSTRNNTYYYFAHTWTSDSYKIKTDHGVFLEHSPIYEKNDLSSELKKYYNFQKLCVEDKKQVHGSPWENHFYTILRSNLEKKKYEIENNFMFDLVIRCRFDLLFMPNLTFEDYFLKAQRYLIIQEKTLYGSIGLMHSELFLPNFDDVFYSGSSLTMDLIDQNLFFLSIPPKTKIVQGINEFDEFNPYTICRDFGPGVIISRWMNKKNIIGCNIDRPFLILRKQLLDKINEPWFDLVHDAAHIY